MTNNSSRSSNHNPDVKSNIQRIKIDVLIIIIVRADNDKTFGSDDIVNGIIGNFNEYETS